MGFLSFFTATRAAPELDTKASAAAITADLCKRFEGFRAKPYLCPANVPTIGYGTTRYPNGKAVSLSDKAVTEQQAEEILVHEIESVYMAGVLDLSPSLANHPEQLAAMASFTYNLGVARYRASTLRKRVDSGEWDDVPNQLSRWVFAGGRKLNGLIRRRQAETDLFMSTLEN